MSVNSNYNIVPVSQLKKHSTQDSGESLFEKFTNPYGDVNLPLKEQGIVTTVFDKTAGKLTVSGGRFPCELKCNDIAFLSSVVDPQGKLKSLIEAGKVIKIKGNSTVCQAQIILLDDTNHTNKYQPFVNGEVANCLKGEENSYLCEAVEPSHKIFSGEIGANFAPNLKIGAKDDFSGWDDMYVYDLAYELEVQDFLTYQRSISGIGNSDFGSNNHIKTYYDHLRTESLWHATQKKHQAFPDAKLVVFGGQAHLSEEWLHEQLMDHQWRYVEITPMQVPPCSLTELVKYYGFDKYSI